MSPIYSQSMDWITTASDNGTNQNSETSEEGENLVHGASSQSPSTVMSSQSSDSLALEYLVNVFVQWWYHLSKINMCIWSPQALRSTRQASYGALDDPDLSFSDPVDTSSSDVESYDEDDMYGLDHGMEVVSESSGDEDDADTSPLTEDWTVCHHIFWACFEIWHLSRIIGSWSCCRRRSYMLIACLSWHRNFAELWVLMLPHFLIHSMTSRLVLLHPI